MIKIAALYKFISLNDYPELKEPILNAMIDCQVYGTLLLAREGINGTISAEEENLENFLSYIFTVKELNLSEQNIQYSYADVMPFLRPKVKLKKEIVTMGVCDIEPEKHRGTYLNPKEWDELLAQDNLLLIDTRNDYEYEIGTFKGAINPSIQTFREFPDYIKQIIIPKMNATTKVAMFCTGGIRCEKSTSLMNALKIAKNRVFHLQGGILNYLETIPEATSNWQGECFVFDARVSVKHGLEQGTYDQCFACRYPITQQDQLSPLYKKGESCPRCYASLPEKTKARAIEREKQILLAEKNGYQHLACNIAQAKITKQQKRESQIAQAQG